MPQGNVSTLLPPGQPSLQSLPPTNALTATNSKSEDASAGHLTPKVQESLTTSTVDRNVSDRPESFQKLWEHAITKVRNSNDGEKLAEVLRAQELAAPHGSEMTMSSLISRLEAEMKRVGMQKRMAETMEKIVPHLNRFAVVGDIAVSTNPNPAALPWAAVRFLLLNLTAGEEIRAKIVQGIAEITILVFECSVYHELYLISSTPKDISTSPNLRKVIVDALSQCIKFLGFALRRQQAVARALTDAFRLEDFSGYLKNLNDAKDKLHDAGFLCEMYHSSQSRDQLKSLFDLMTEMRLESSERAEEKVKSQLRDLLIDPKNVFDHIYHPSDSFCLEGTRVQVLNNIQEWARDPKSPTICWLPGLAGTGKSTISRTVCRDLKGKILGASFFFKKGAGNRGNGRYLFAILAYQLALNLSPIRPHILEAVREDHSLAMAPMQVQWQKLIRDPLVKLQDEGFTMAVTLVLDALDECDETDRGQILLLLITTCPNNLRVFLTSRPELDIMGHFADEEPRHREIVLHKLEIGTIEADFRVFLQQALSSFVIEHNRTHRQKHLQLSSDWPGDERFQLLLHKALPLFIAAATFVRMIRDRHWAKGPDYKIDFIIDKSTKVNSEYETLYKPVLNLILSGAPDEDQKEAIQSFIDIIGSLVMLASPLSIMSLAKLLGIDAQDISSQVDPLRSVIDVPEDDSPVQLFHLSFRDYILSKSAGDLQVDESETHAKLASRCMELLRKALKTDICGLVSPGKSLSDVEPSFVDEHLTPEIRYACLYWVHHLKESGKQIWDESAVYSFLKHFFLNWLEVLCLIRRIDDSLLMLQELQSMISVSMVCPIPPRNRAHNTQETSNAQMLQFIQDAWQFIRYFRAGIEQTPLQLYHSGSVFCPKTSIAPSPLDKRQYPEYIMQPSTIDLNWPQNQTLEVHRVRLSHMAFLPNGRLATSSFRGELKVWDPKSCSCLHSLSPEFDALHMIVLSWYDSRILAVGWPKGIKIWNLDTGTFTQKLFLKDCISVDRPAFSDDGKFLCSICLRGLQYVGLVYCLDTEECVSEFEIPKGSRQRSLSLKGQWVAAITKESLILSEWGASKEQSWNSLDTRQERDILCFQFSSDGGLIASLSKQSYASVVAKVWRTKSNECLHTLEFDKPSFPYLPALTKDWLVISSILRCQILDMGTGVVSQTVSSNFEAGPVISDDGTVLAGQTMDGAVRIWDLTSKALTEGTIESTMGVDLITRIADDSTVLSCKRGTIKIWDVKSGTCKETFELNDERMPITLKATATDAPLFAILKETTVEIWKINPVRHVNTIDRYANMNYTIDPATGQTKRLFHLTVSPNGDRLAIRSSDPGVVEIWDINNAVLYHRLEFPLKGFPCIAFSSDGTKVAYNLMNNIKVRCLPGLETLTMNSELCPKESLLRTLAFHNGRLIGTYQNSQVQVWDAATGECLFLSDPCPELRLFSMRTNFLNTEAFTSYDHGQTDGMLGTYYIGQDSAWVMKNGEKLLWLPPDYRPESVYMSGGTMVIGTVSERVLFLHMRE
ncbi:hypothetical protein IL306_006636 [Fusarium sp. DS 682]|nr:hypothetical protein IL306_006636 [Fusarium sp. DS 682]